jgi:sec-independent protein translocase protein TatB
VFDINGGEFLILLVVAVLVIGPERLPKYAEQLAQLVKRLRAFVQETKTRVDDELGDDLKDVDWAALDPRKYDPRRIVREALLDEVMPAITGLGSLRPTAPATAVPAPATPAERPGGPVPFDDEAT